MNPINQGQAESTSGKSGKKGEKRQWDMFAYGVALTTLFWKGPEYVFGQKIVSNHTVKEINRQSESIQKESKTFSNVAEKFENEILPDLNSHGTRSEHFVNTLKEEVPAMQQEAEHLRNEEGRISRALEEVFGQSKLQEIEDLAQRIERNANQNPPFEKLGDSLLEKLEYERLIQELRGQLKIAQDNEEMSRMIIEKYKKKVMKLKGQIFSLKENRN